MKCNIASLPAKFIRRVGERFRLLEANHRDGLSPEQKALRLKAIAELEVIQMEWRKHDVTAKDIRDAIREGRS